MTESANRALPLGADKVPGVENAPVEPLERPGVPLVQSGTRPEQTSNVSPECQALDPDRGSDDGHALIAATSDLPQVSIPVKPATSPSNCRDTEIVAPDMLPANHESSMPSQSPTTTTSSGNISKLFLALSSAVRSSPAWPSSDALAPLPATLSAELTKTFTEVRTGTVKSQQPTGGRVSQAMPRSVPKQVGTKKRPAVQNKSVATKSSGAPQSGACIVVESASGSNTVPGVDRKTNTEDVSMPVAPEASTSTLKTKCWANRKGGYRKLLRCVDHEAGMPVKGCPNCVTTSTLANKKKKSRSNKNATLTQKATSPKKQSLKKARRSKMYSVGTQTKSKSFSSQGSVSLFLSMTNGTVASTQVNHRRQTEKGCITAVKRCGRLPSRVNGNSVRPTTTPQPCDHAATRLRAMPILKTSSLRKPEGGDMSLWDATKVTECNKGDSVERRVVPREMSNEELVVPVALHSVGLFNVTRIQEEVADCEDSANQERLVPEAASLLGATWIEQELMEGEDNSVEHCIGSPGSNQLEEAKVKQEPMECDDSSAG